MSAENINPISDLDLGVTVRGLVPGQKVLNRFTLQRVLGRGGMGVVWLARDEALDFDVALKFLPEVLAKDRTAVEELKREARRSLELSHPHIVKFYYFFQDENCAGISMEYVAGDTLGNLRLLRPGKVFDVEEIRPWVHQLCQALQYAHQDVKIVHRDLKPANLMVDSQGRLKVTDFGIAKSVTESLTRATLHKGGVAGTLVYMSPQQAMGDPPSVADDIYALGATMYELLTSKPPFYSGEILAQVREKVPPPLSQRRKELGIEAKNIPPHWERTIAACLHKDPSQRPASALELIERLRLGAAPQVVRAPIRPSGVSLVTPEEPTVVADVPPAAKGTPLKAASTAPQTPPIPPKGKKAGPPTRGRGTVIEIETELVGPPTTDKPPSTIRPLPGTTPPSSPPVRESAPKTSQPPTPPPAPKPAPVPEAPKAPAIPPPPSTRPPAVAAATQPPPPAPSSTPAPVQSPLFQTPPPVPPAAPPPAMVPEEPAPVEVEAPLSPEPAPQLETAAGEGEGPPEVVELPPSPAEDRPWLAPETVAGLRRVVSVMLKTAAVVILLAALVYGGINGWHYYQLKRFPPGLIIVRTEPPQATVELRGTKVYTAPAGSGDLAQVVPGEYWLVVSHPGYQTLTNHVQLEGQQGTIYARHRRLTVTMTPLRGTVAVSPVPLDALYVISARRTVAGLVPPAVTNNRPAVPVPLPIGEYEVYLTRPGYRAMRTNIAVQPDQAVTLFPALARSVGSVKVESLPVAARFVLTGPEGEEKTGQCPLVASNLPTGPYRLRLEADKYGVFFTNFNVLEDRESVVVGVLSRLQGELTWASDLPVLRYTLDGPVQLKGTAEGEFRQRLPAGEYQLILSASGYHTRTQRVVVEADQTLNLGRLTLPRITGWLLARVEPAPARLVLGTGQSVPAGQAIELPEGSYEVSAVLEGYEARPVPVTIRDRLTNQLTLKMVRSMGSVVFQTDPPEATNYLRFLSRDLPGRDQANVPNNQPVVLPTGEYQLDVGMPRYGSAHPRFEVRPGVLTNLGTIVLEPLRGGIEVAFAPGIATAVLKPEDVRGGAPVTNQQPGRLALPADGLQVGNYTLSLSCPGFSNIISRVTLREGEILRLPRVVLPRLMGGVEVVGTMPAGAQITLQGPKQPLLANEAVNLERRRSPNERSLLFPQLPTGSYLIFAEAAGYEKVQSTVEVREGATVTVDLGAMARKLGALTVATQPEDGQLRLEMLQSEAGNPAEFQPQTGRSPMFLSRLPTGRYLVRASRPRSFTLPGWPTNAWTATAEVEVRSGQTNQVDLPFPFAMVQVETVPPGARLLLEGRTLRDAGGPPLRLLEFGVEERLALLARAPNHRATHFLLDGKTLGLRPQTSLTFTQTLAFWPGPQGDERVWINSLGMKFVNLNRKVFMCVWECRVQDFTNVVSISEVADRTPYEPLEKDKAESSERGVIHRAPMVHVSWSKAKDFCARLQNRELGVAISSNHLYRLPTDLEWSLAAGLPPEPGSTPRQRSGQLGAPWYVWGTTFPPPVNCGNYPQWVGFDAFEKVAPVGMFLPNSLGIYDLGGNVWEWCEDEFEPGKGERVLRGGSWKWDTAEEVYPGAFLASFRWAKKPDYTADNVGFRVVLEIKDETEQRPPPPPMVTETPAKTPAPEVRAMRQALGWGDRALAEVRGEPRVNLKAARSHWEAAAKAGDAESKYRLAYLVENKLDVQRGDESRVQTWLMEAAEKGLLEAKLQLAVQYFNEAGNHDDPASMQKRNQAQTYCEELAKHPKAAIAARAALLRYTKWKVSSGAVSFPSPERLQWLFIAEALGHWKAFEIVRVQESSVRTFPERKSIWEEGRKRAEEFLKQYHSFNP